MRLFAFVMLFGISLSYAQQTSPQTSAMASCGPSPETFNVSVSKSQHPAPNPDAGKSIIYVFQDDTQFQFSPRPTSRVGVDGKWIGATHSNSYLYSVVDAGEHHLCVQWQGVGMRSKQARLHFNADPGDSYYFRIKDTWIRDNGRKEIELSQIDSDEGQMLASKASYATAQPKR